jgi:hypothetical protein
MKNINNPNSNKNNLSEHIKFYRAEDYNSNYPRELKHKKLLKHKLFEIRKYFIDHSTLFTLLKIFLGFLLFGFPIFLSKLIINNNNITTGSGSGNTNYTSAALPFMIATGLFTILILLLILIKVCLLCKENKL